MARRWWPWAAFSSSTSAAAANSGSRRVACCIGSQPVVGEKAAGRLAGLPLTGWQYVTMCACTHPHGSRGGGGVWGGKQETRAQRPNVKNQPPAIRVRATHGIEEQQSPERVQVWAFNSGGTTDWPWLALSIIDCCLCGLLAPAFRRWITEPTYSSARC